MRAYRAKYWGLSTTFNPTKFDPASWASAAAAAGMKWVEWPLDLLHPTSSRQRTHPHASPRTRTSSSPAPPQAIGTGNRPMPSCR